MIVITGNDNGGNFRNGNGSLTAIIGTVAIKITHQNS
jgi:hypothetical protein